MGTYLKIPKNKEGKIKLRKWFDYWQPFYNDFGQKNTFNDIFEDIRGEYIYFKIGVMEKEFYPKKAVEEIKKLIVEFKGDPTEC